ncbi:MAG TPA: DoxX family protein [Pyrinomonadaceae bacterium]|jgi:putative oxidoreductase
MFRRLIATAPVWFTVPVRLTLGLIFIGHGAQKVLGAFGGRGLSASVAGDAPWFFMRPSWLWLGAAALSEFIGGILILAGLLTRVGAFLIAVTMFVAIFAVHWPNFFLTNRGIEFALALLGMAVALVIAGGGKLSVDQLLSGGRRR